MQSIGDLILNSPDLLAGNPALAGEAKDFFKRSMEAAKDESPEERQKVLRGIMERRVARFNAERGRLDAVDGYNCKLCQNRGSTARLIEQFGMLYDVYPPCQCMEIRRSIQRLKQSGMETAIRELTFDRFRIDKPWQKVMMDTAKAWLANGVGKGEWLFIGGAVGSGKTHICTAAAGELLYQRPVYYMTWPAESTRLKANIYDDDAYNEAMMKLKEIDVLYIDDFFKPVMGRDGVLPPQPTDIKIAYELINHRYINHLPTIISTERYPSELLDIDMGTSSRIAERSRHYTVSLERSKDKNYRIRADALL